MTTPTPEIVRAAASRIAGDVRRTALAACLARQRESGALLMHAYDQAEVVAGAGTLGGEIEDEAGLPERVLVSVFGANLDPASLA